MFLGHFGAALAGKYPAPRVSLGWLFAAGQLPDLVWPLLVLAGLERVRIAPGDTAFTPLAFEHYPWSHSLLAVLVWAALLALLYVVTHRNRAGALILAGLVVSHWVLDWITHRPDLPLYPGGSARLGLGLWRSVSGTLIAESVLYAAGVWLYTRATVARDRVGRLGFWTMVIVLLVIEVANVFSPPPPSNGAVAMAALGIWIFLPLAAWVGRHREVGGP
ncbi:MAG TPA: metal-dependent hydrolase [Gemmatimonadaceae bacterium]|nr:metal-dependent hydrolase [Gemmatimonadaceae bacterium]